MYKLKFLIKIDKDYTYDESIYHLTMETNFIPQIGMTIFLPHNYFEILEKSVKEDEIFSNIILDVRFKVIDVFYSFNDKEQNFSIVLSN